MKFKIIILIISGCLLSNSVFAINFQKWRTNNGAKVLFIESHALKMLDIRVIFDAGSARDGKIFGLANMTNRLISTGTKTKNEEQISLNFESYGAIFNHQSLRDMSLFSLRTLSNKKILNYTISTFADIILNPVFRLDILIREKNRILQQIKINQQSPAFLADKYFMQAIYGKHPYAHDTIGTKDSIGKLTITQIKQFYKQYFVAKNTTIVIVGDLSLAAAKSLANQVVGKLPTGKKPSKILPVRALTKSYQKNIQFPSKQTHILIGQSGIARGSNDYFSLYLGNYILGGSGLISRLSQEIREKNGLAYSAYSYFLPMRAKGFFKISTQTKQKSTKDALRIAKQTLENFVNNGATKQELHDAKRSISGGFALRIDSNSKISEYLSLIGFYNLPSDYLDTFVDKINQIKLTTMQDVWKKHIDTNKMVIIMVGDFKKNDQ